MPFTDYIPSFSGTSSQKPKIKIFENYFKKDDANVEDEYVSIHEPGLYEEMTKNKDFVHVGMDKKPEMEDGYVTIHGPGIYEDMTESKNFVHIGMDAKLEIDKEYDIIEEPGIRLKTKKYDDFVLVDVETTEKEASKWNYGLGNIFATGAAMYDKVVSYWPPATSRIEEKPNRKLYCKFVKEAAFLPECVRHSCDGGTVKLYNECFKKKKFGEK